MTYLVYIGIPDAKVVDTENLSDAFVLAAAASRRAGFSEVRLGHENNQPTTLVARFLKGQRIERSNPSERTLVGRRKMGIGFGNLKDITNLHLTDCPARDDG